MYGNHQQALQVLSPQGTSNPQVQVLSMDPQAASSQGMQTLNPSPMGASTSPQIIYLQYPQQPQYQQPQYQQQQYQQQQYQQPQVMYGGYPTLTPGAQQMAPSLRPSTAPSVMPQAMPAQRNVVRQPMMQGRPESYLIFSCLVYFCCNCLFGMIAMVLSMLSRNAADEGDYGSAKQRGKEACYVSIAGIVCSVISLAVVLGLGFGLSWWGLSV